MDQKRSRSVKFNKLLSKRQLPGMIKQREKTRVAIFRFANTSHHQVYYEDHEITEISLKIWSTTMGDDGGNDVNAWINFTRYH